MGLSLNEKDRERLWVSPRLKDVLAAIQKDIALEIKTKYKLKELTVNGTLASDALAAQYLGDKSLHFKIRKVGLNKGVLEFVPHFGQTDT